MLRSLRSARRRRHGAQARIRLVLPLLPRPRPLPRPRQHRRRDAAAGRRRSSRPFQRRPADAFALGQHKAEYRLTVFRDGNTGAARRWLRRGRTLLRAPSRGRCKARRRLPCLQGREISRRRGRLYVTRRRLHQQGEFWEALNTASNEKLPVLFVVEDNEYAISTPVEVNTPGGNISKLVANFP